MSFFSCCNSNAVKSPPQNTVNTQIFILPAVVVEETSLNLFNVILQSPKNQAFKAPVTVKLPQLTESNVTHKTTKAAKNTFSPSNPLKSPKIKGFSASVQPRNLPSLPTTNTSSERGHLPGQENRIPTKKSEPRYASATRGFKIASGPSEQLKYVCDRKGEFDEIDKLIELEELKLACEDELLDDLDDASKKEVENEIQEINNQINKINETIHN